MGLRGILLDFDDTLYDYKECNSAATIAALKSICQRHSIGMNSAKALFEKARMQVKANTRAQAASHSRLLYFKAMLEMLEGRTNAGYSLRLERLFWEKYMQKMTIPSQAIEFLKWCRGKGLRIVILTNLTAQIQLRKAVASHIDRFVDFIITSEEAGAEKPAGSIVRLAMEKAGCKRDELVLVGDIDEKATAVKNRLAFFPIKGKESWNNARGQLEKMLTPKNVLGKSRKTASPVGGRNA